MTKTRQSTKSQALTRVGIVLVILILLNIISIRIFGRLDMTERGLFSLSEASKELMRSLDDKVTVKAYFTEDMPAPYNNTRRAFLDQLNEYKAYSKGNLQFEFIDPTGEKGEQEAQQSGVGPVQVQVVNEDKFEVKRAFMGAVFLYEDKKEVIPVVQNTTSLEYDISTIIKRLTSKSRKKVGFLSGNGEPGLNELSRVQQLLSKQYDVTIVDVTGAKPVPEDVSTLIVMAPKSRFSEPVKFQVDQYIMRGGKIAFLLNKADGDLQQRMGQVVENGLEDLLENYGLRINADMVRDVQCANISIVQQQFGMQMQSQVPYPYLPLVSNFSKSNAMVKDLQGTMLFFASSVDTTALSDKGLSAEVFMRSSKQSSRQPGPYFMLDPLQRFTQADFAEKEIPLGVVVAGKFKSPYAGKPIPQDTTAGAAIPFGTPLTSSPDTRIVLIGDGDFARDEYNPDPRNQDNITLLANIVDYLMDDAGLITIRSKDVSMPPLEQVADGTKKMIKYGNMFAPPVLVLLFGLVRWRMRKARKKALEFH